MKLIARESGTAQALLHYHFETKENLYDHLFSQRALAVNSARERALDDLLSQPQPPTLEEILAVLFARMETSGNPALFSQIVSAASISKDPREKMIFATHYDGIAKRFIAAFRLVLPQMQPDEAVWAYLLAWGARMQAYAGMDRADRLMAELSSADRETAHEALIAFAAAGIRGLVREQKPRDEQPAKQREQKRPKSASTHAVRSDAQ